VRIYNIVDEVNYLLAAFIQVRRNSFCYITGQRDSTFSKKYIVAVCRVCDVV
jgi:hypothetical protein